ncbi:two-component system OmpR family sensor kinase [Kibdelosporangium banguiense]|uniref:histidine kinase n=1 Tax=Kibdelosporangium banguiense TaxID=1365924 RepID=A0ABS4T5S4_9PSEU|nr:HAMP domain-containing sensor histidine kinase [Kibdelosporangium banguiense]MBP2319783.1 two-component system OmpR family sensor kinase [Kibdelosporangium banguiense]
MNRWQRTPLGTRLALALGVLSLVVFGIVGTVLVTSTRDFLERQLNQQITKTQYDQAMYLNKQISAYQSKWKAPQDWKQITYDPATGTVSPIPGNPLPSEDGVEDLTRLAKDMAGKPEEYRTISIHGEGTFQARACQIEIGNQQVVLISAAPLGDLNSTMRWLLIVSISAFGAALVVLVVAGRLVLRRGLRPLSDMAHTAHDIASHDLTDSSNLPVRADGKGGGPEVEELRTALNVMLDHIDSSLAARTAAEQRLRRFIADASHELRTPLTSIRGYADLFRYAAANEPAEREAHLAKIREETERMSVLVDDLLLLARLDSETPLRLEEIDLVDVASAAAQAFVAAHPQYPLDFEAPSRVIVHGDPMRLRQVLDNLLTNIARHTPRGTSVQLEVTGGAVMIVTDTGPGIPPEHQARIFDRFYRIDDSRSRNIGGTGLGLSIVHSIITAHGGTVNLSSQPGRTTFIISLNPESERAQPVHRDRTGAEHRDVTVPGPQPEL